MQWLTSQTMKLPNDTSGSIPAERSSVGSTRAMYQGKICWGSTAGDGTDVDLQTDSEYADVEVETSIPKEERDLELQAIMRLRSYSGFENRRDFLHNEQKKKERAVHIPSKDVEVERPVKKEEIEEEFRSAVKSSGHENLNNRHNHLHGPHGFEY
ncbi:hypothetical protein HS088_TW03G01119 [Tripterygium wilfordii]|uniref:Uncharacterized protein n=1 Tax=Tripterygium wilfordii TaxID=458696 RepID=A0A7J7DWW7_TRIWF|nr:hypothetical protein HS088_TW03G01119 [Tripterygium wilfordii]